MKEFLARLTPMERRFMVGVLTAVFIVLNMVFIWPHFGDYSALKVQITSFNNTMRLRESVIGETKNYQGLVRNLELEGEAVPVEDQSIDVLRTIREEAANSNIALDTVGRQSTRTNSQFFIEQTQPLTIHAGEGHLVEFLYNLGAGKSNIRVSTLTVRPSAPQRQQLEATITLVASYQKKTPARSTGPLAAAPAAQPATPKK